MAREATARLYDVDENLVRFRKLDQTERYDQGTISFRARKGQLIDLDKLHESIWATRLSGGTRSGLVSLEVTAIGHVVRSNERTVLRVADSDAEFLLAPHPDAGHADVFAELQSVTDDTLVKLTGVVDDYRGRWPDVLQTKPKKPRRILITGLETPEGRPRTREEADGQTSED